MGCMEGFEYQRKPAELLKAKLPSQFALGKLSWLSELLRRDSRKPNCILPLRQTEVMLAIAILLT